VPPTLRKNPYDRKKWLEESKRWLEENNALHQRINNLNKTNKVLQDQRNKYMEEVESYVKKNQELQIQFNITSVELALMRDIVKVLIRVIEES